MDLDEMLHVDGCRDVDELMNFWARMRMFEHVDVSKIRILSTQVPCFSAAT